MNTTDSTLEPMGLPGSPVGLTCTPQARAMEVHWMSPGSLHSGYEITYALSAGSDVLGTVQVAKDLMSGTVTGLQPSTLYEFCVYAVNAEGRSAGVSASGRTLAGMAASATAEDLAGLDGSNAVGDSLDASKAMTTPLEQAPGTVLTPTFTPLPGVIAVAWGGAARAKGYEIEYALASDEKIIAVIKRGMTTNVQITGLKSETAYKVMVYATNTAGRGEGKGETVTTKFKAEIPSPPSNLVGIPTLSEVRLAWQMSKPAPSYKVSYGRASSADKLEEQTTKDLTYTFKELTTGASYWFKVTACNDAGCSAPAQVTVKLNDLPVAPQNLNGDATPHTIALRWNSNHNNYILEYALKGSSSFTTIKGSGKSYLLTGLVRGESYDIYVRVVSSDGVESPKTLRTIPTPYWGDESPVIQVAKFDQSGVTLAWVKVEGAEKYEIIYFLGAAGRELGRCEVTSNQATITGLPYETLCYFEVRSISGAIKSKPGSVSVTTGVDETCVRLLRTAKSTSTVFIQWEPPVSSDDVQGYDISCPGLEAVYTQDPHCLFKGLAASTNYVFTVKSRRLNNLAGTAVTASVSLPKNLEPPTRPRGLTLTGLLAGQATLSWEASKDNNRVTGYSVKRNGAAQTEVSGTSVTLTGLQIGTSYTFEVRAINAIGTRSVPSKLVYDTIPPCSPTKVVLADINANGEAILSWAAVSDDSGIAGYQVILNDGNPLELQWPSHLFSNLKADTNYIFKVRARDNGGNLSLPTELKVLIPPKPTGLVVSPITNGSLTLSWADSLDYPVVGYQIRRNEDSPIDVKQASHTFNDIRPATKYTFIVRAYNNSQTFSAPAELTITTP